MMHSVDRRPVGHSFHLSFHLDGARPLSRDLVAAVAAFCDRVEDASGAELAVIQLGGAPAGPWPHDADVHLVSKWERVLRRLERLNVGTVAVATGDCGGVAMELLLATDYRVASADLRLLVPAYGGAVWPGMALYRLANQVGLAQVRRAVLFGVPIGAAEALERGLVDEVAADPAAAVATLGSRSGPELAIRRQLMLDATTTSFEDALGRHLAACDRTLRRTAIAAAS